MHIECAFLLIDFRKYLIYFITMSGKYLIYILHFKVINLYLNFLQFYILKVILIFIFGKQKKIVKVYLFVITSFYYFIFIQFIVFKK